MTSLDNFNETSNKCFPGTGEGNEDTLDGSWQAIYVALLLTFLQCTFFLCVFECARRSPTLESVYDRRRGFYQTRMPPPLMQRRGWFRGWLGFEWWRIKISDEAYIAKSKQERTTLLKERREREAKKHLTGNPENEFLQRAEKECFVESPYFDPTSLDDEDGMEEGLFDEGEEQEEQEEGARKQEGKPNTETEAATAMDPIDSVGEKKVAAAATTVVAADDQTVPVLKSPPSSPPSSLRKRVSIKELDKNDELPISSSERTSRSIRKVVFGSDEANRLAKLRHDSPSSAPTWDTQTLSSASSVVVKFLYHKVLMMSEDEEAAAEATDPAIKPENPNSTPFVSKMARRQFRRPLSAEQQELLRCIGVDAFMTLRFLVLGFHVSFYPMLLSLVTLLPIYKTSKQCLTSGFFSATVMSLEDGSGRFWLVLIFAFVFYLYILRRIWIEWELFLPLRYDFLENGDFSKEKYKEQYRKTCLVEYIPKAQQRDKSLYSFFEGIFPGQVKRAEVLLNTENLRKLIHLRMEHIYAYEKVYAKKVHQRSKYLRDLDAYENSGVIKKSLGAAIKPSKPKEPMAVVIHSIDQDFGNVFYKRTRTVRDARTYPALKYHHEMIQQINKLIEDEYFRLAQQQHRPHEKGRRESRISKWLGIKYLTGSDTDSLHSSTAFVEFRTLAAKQEAIQCNMIGTSRCMVVTPVPEVSDLNWGNMHVSRALIETRKAWVNLFLTGCLLFWSFLVALIRGRLTITEWIHVENPAVTAFLDVYLPAFLVEGLVRIIPFLITAVCSWIRFKSFSEVHHFVLQWYFAFRLLTFIFVIIGGDIVSQSNDLVDDPVEFLESLANNVAEHSNFFASYVLVAGGIQIFFRLSQLHNLGIHWTIHHLISEEAVSQRRLDYIRKTMKVFHADEFIPLFLFIFMVGALYGALAPICGVFVSGFFFLAFKVFKFMSLYVYGKQYEGGGFLFYTLTSILFWILYLIILVVAGYLAKHGSNAMTGIFLLLLPITYFVHRDVHRTFVTPSKTLSLTKARVFDETQDSHSPHQRRLQTYLEAKQALEDFENCACENDGDQVPNVGDETETNQDVLSSDASLTESQRRQQAAERLQRLYVEGDTFSDMTDSEISCQCSDFFVYRQPSLNRVTWEVEPRPYRETVTREAAEVWR